MTLTSTDICETLKNSRDYEILDTFDKSMAPEKMKQMRREALLTDLFITGTNAVTEDGYLVNLDMNGNRVGAITYGPEHVIILVGRNKIVKDTQAAMNRIKEYAAPTNVMRLNKKTPCLKTSKCENCRSDERICNTWTIAEKSFPKKRIKVVLINESLGL